MEIYKEIPGFEELYQCTNTGDIYSLNYKRSKTIKKLKPGINKGGYLKVALFKNKKAYNIDIHRLVALTFLENLEFKKEVNHINGDKLNNHYTNLEWVTPSQNMKHAFEKGLNRQILNLKNSRMRKVIDISTNIIYKSAKEAAIQLNLNYGTLIPKLCGRRFNQTNLRYV